METKDLFDGGIYCLTENQRLVRFHIYHTPHFKDVLNPEVCYYDPGNVDGVPVTDEILTRLGFYAGDDLAVRGDILLCFTGFGFWGFDWWDVHLSTRITTPVRSVHELQRLYLALTGSVLDVSPLLG